MSSEVNADLKLNLLTRAWLRLMDYLITEIGGGPKLVKLSSVVNLQKAGNLILSLVLMKVYNNWSPTAVTITALTGGWGLCWLLKESIFPDAKWNVKMTFLSTAASLVTLPGVYLLIPYTTIAGKAECPPEHLCAAMILFVLGVTLRLGADCQKYFVLRSKKELITDGFFARVRHPNYLGEMMIYGSFAWVSQDPRSWALLLTVWIFYFLPMMLRKEASMSRYEGWKAYTKKAGFVIPRLW
jgi:protein-S-isoprenylcysteine O-methyltransferase Ste14